MEESDSESIGLNCPFCQKSYTHESNRRELPAAESFGTGLHLAGRARSKHISYCRKKHLSGPVSRRKACDECVRAKVRCVFASAACSRCTSRGRPCTYQGRLFTNADCGNVASVTSQGALPQGKSSVTSSSSAGGSPTLCVDEFGVATVDPFIDMLSENNQLLQQDCGWTSEASSNGFIDMLDILTTPDLGFDRDIDNVADKLPQAPNHMAASGHFQQLSSLLPASIPNKDPSSLLERRNFSQVDLQITSDLALHMLHSYLYTMTDQGSLPPFIHTRYQYLKENDTGRPSPLSAAMKLAKMLFIGYGTNKTLIWKLIQIEQERLLYDHSAFDRWQALEALQSIILYILLRINEGRREYTNFDTKLFISLNAICRHISTNFGNLVSSDELNGEMISWKDWVFYESRRRSATVIYIIDSILYARISEPGPGMPEYNYAPAPSPLALWNAENELDWTAGYADYLHANTTHGMLKNGDLVALRKAASGHQGERWYAYADSLGLLVTLTANLII